MNAIVKAKGLSKQFGTTKAMDDVSFTIEKCSLTNQTGLNI